MPLFQTIDIILHNVILEAKKRKKKSAFVIVTTAKKSKDEIIFLPQRSTPTLECGAATVYTRNTVIKLIKKIDGKVDYILVDAEQKIHGLHDLVKIILKHAYKSQVLTFKSNDSTVDSTDAILTQLIENYFDKKIAIIGVGNIGSKLALKLAERGIKVFIAQAKFNDAKKIANALNLIKPKNCKGQIIAKSSSNIAKNCDVLIGYAPGMPVITRKMILQMKKNGLILDGGLGTIQKDAIVTANKRGMKIMRIDIRAGFASVATLAFETKNLLENISGRRKIRGVDVIAGGVYGKYGDIVVDNISQPKEIIGLADGEGGITRNSLDFESNITTVKRFLSKNRKIN